MREEANGCGFEVRTIDADGSSDTTPVVWGHGLSSSMASEDELRLIDWSTAAPGRQVLRYDARGHGESDSTPDPGDYRWSRLADDQLAIATATGIDRYVAAGASMGCATALFTALAAPERIERLVLVIPPTAWDTRAAQTDTYLASADLLEAGQLEVLERGIEAAPTPNPFMPSAGEPNDWKERSRRTIRSTDPTRLARVFRGAAVADLPDPDDLRRIERPALILAWTGDPGHPMTTAIRLVDLLPNTELHVASTRPELDTWSTRIAEFLA